MEIAAVEHEAHIIALDPAHNNAFYVRGYPVAAVTARSGRDSAFATGSV
ncbi:MAG: hypothetical protein AAGB11_03545 [Pseudomonadota bacterium]